MERSTGVQLKSPEPPKAMKASFGDAKKAKGHKDSVKGTGPKAASRSPPKERVASLGDLDEKIKQMEEHFKKQIDEAQAKHSK